MVLAYHVIFGTYGFWLPNDPRGSWSDFVRSYEIYLQGRATKVTTRRSVAMAAHDQSSRMQAKQALRDAPVVMTGRQAKSVGHGFAVQAQKSQYVIHACAIMPDHVHLVVGRHRYPIEQVINLLKCAATRRLIDDDQHPLVAYRRPDGRVPSPWAEGSGWQVYLNDAEGIVRAIRYVEENPVKAGLAAQHWRCVTEYVG